MPSPPTVSTRLASYFTALRLDPPRLLRTWGLCWKVLTQDGGEPPGRSPGQVRDSYEQFSVCCLLFLLLPPLRSHQFLPKPQAPHRTLFGICPKMSPSNCFQQDFLSPRPASEEEK